MGRKGTAIERLINDKLDNEPELFDRFSKGQSAIIVKEGQYGVMLKSMVISANQKGLKTSMRDGELYIYK